MKRKEKSRIDLLTELVIAKQERNSLNEEKVQLAEGLTVINEEFLFQMKEKLRTWEELIAANEERIIKAEGKGKRADELIITNKELIFQSEERLKRAEELKLAKEIAEEFEYKSAHVSADADKLHWLKSKSETIIVGPSSAKICGVPCYHNDADLQKSAEKVHGDCKTIDSEIVKPDKNNQNGLFKYEFRIVSPDNLIYWNNPVSSPVLDDSGKIISRTGIAKDITERYQNIQELVKAMEKAEKSDRLKSAFLANMSHEIRTPMNGILGFAELLKQPKLTGEEQQEYIRIIEKSGARMLNIINNIIDISKVEAGLMEMNLKETNINDQMEFVYKFFMPEIESKNLQLLLKIPSFPKERIVFTDREKVYAVLINLVKNAIKYTHKGSVIFGYTKRGKELEFFVRDTGIGIPIDRQLAVFERFIQADISDIQALQGAGLGLSIAKAYVILLGGRIWLESNEGEGSAFYFTIPCNSELEEECIDKENVMDVEIKDNVRNLKVLIAEDDEVSSLLIELEVRKYCKEILIAKNGFEAVDICCNDPGIDLVLMDIQMPILNGYEATRIIRKTNDDVIIIAQTAFAQLGDREKVIEAGCNDYISKPIKSAELVRLIHKYFDN